MSDRLYGACLCGQFSWSAEGAPEFQGYCHCDHCRRMSGSGRTPFLGFSADRVRLEGQTTSYADIAANGGSIARHFCPTCGSRAYSVPGSAPDIRIFYAGSLGAPDRFTPSLAIHSASAVAWDPVEPGLADFPGAAPG